MPNLYLSLTEAEAAALSCAAIWADGQHRHPNLQSSQDKLRAVLDRPTEHVDEAQRWVNLEC